MNELYTPYAQQALDGAEAVARHYNHTYIGTEHVLACILKMENCTACKCLKRMGLDNDDLGMELDRIIGRGEAYAVKGALPLTARTRKVLEFAKMEAIRAKAEKIGTEHIMLATLREGESVGAQILFGHNVTADTFAKSLSGQSEPAQASGETGNAGQGHDDASDGDGDDPGLTDTSEGEQDGDGGKKIKTPALNTYGRDLTKAAMNGELDPVIGRKAEIERILQVLSRRTKNNAVLIGEAGVGKTAVVEGLAEAIAAGDAPERMRGKRVIALDMTRVVAGTMYRGQFEERLKQLIEEAKNARNCILFLDEIHTLVGAGGPEGAMDAANILKPSLARGEIQVVGATTLKEYHKSIEKDAALERRFQSVIVNEPSQDDAIEILKGIAPRYEKHHNVKYEPEALSAAVKLTARYLPARLLPDKAIDAIDETGSRTRMKNAVRPPDMKADEEKIAELNLKKQDAANRGVYEEAAKWRDAEKAAKAALKRRLDAWKAEHAEKVLTVTADDIAATVASISGVPVERMSFAAAERLLGMERDLNTVVVGQTEAISSIARALRRSRANLGDPKRPIGSFLFLGPTGVGKTLLAKMLAEKVYGDPKSLISLDMTEFSDKFTSSRLVGAPPGYVGYDEGGQLTERVRRRPYSVVLFDEFEKASPDVMNMLLQILDEGKLTDGQGRTIDFRNTIIIATANLGFDFAREGNSFGFLQDEVATSYDALKEKLLAEAKRTFRPELLNRFDETVVFRKLDSKNVETILNLELALLRSRLSEKDMTLDLDKKAIEFLVKNGSDEAMGARPLRRAVQRFVEDPLAELLLGGKLKPGKIKGTLSEDGHLTFRQ